MAQQDFDINIRVNANTAQVDAIRQSFEKLGAQVQVTNAQAAGGGAAGTADVTQFGNVIGRLIGLAAGAAAYRLVEQITLTAEHIEKITAELDKQGEQLVKNAQSMAEQARFARTEADVLKIGEASLKEIEATHRRTKELAQEELNAWEKILDAFNQFKQGFSFGAQPDIGPIQKAHDLALAQAAQQEETARNSATYSVQAARIEEARRAAQSYSAQTEELNQRIKEQKALAEELWQEGQIESYVTAARVLEKLKKELQDVIKEQERFRATLEKTGGQDVAGKLTPGGEIGQLGKQLQELGGLKNLTPVEEKAARDAFVATQKELRDKEMQATKDARNAEIQAQRDRYEGAGLPAMKPGESQSQYNAELLTAIRDLAAAWK